MWWRIGYSILHIFLGLAVLKVIGTPLIDIVQSIMGHELIEDPHDLLYSFIYNVLTVHPIYISYFLSFYFIFWGVVDIVLSYNLLKHKLWAFPVSFILIGLFILYEIFRFTHTHSIILLFVIFIDVTILWIIWREYRKLYPSSMSLL